MDRRYAQYREAIRGRVLPLAYVDLDAFDANVAAIAQRAGTMPICVASKSVRCTAMLRRILDHSPQFHSLMAFDVREAVQLFNAGFNDILVAYPALSTVAHSGLCGRLREGARITLMVDSSEHVDYLESIGAREETVIPVCLDVDMSYRFPGIYFGVHRSSITTPEAALQVWRSVQDAPHVDLVGVMGYEAQIAGLNDDVPGQRTMNMIVRYLKHRSVKDLAERRCRVVEALRAAGAQLRFVNGGGTGSVETTVQEAVITEVTVGSGFYAPSLFDHYRGFQHLPAAGFAIEITRRPTEEIYTCAGGGYIASGSIGIEKQPKPFLPEGVKLIAQEGAGEVQTPVRYTGPEHLKLGDPIFMRHSKAGELCERFKTLLLIQAGEVVGEVPTYRGEGLCFV
ncbi:MAG: amino acid deaminase/aldolase [Candidatus Hydrogenedentes bacterium]|nr:amino acid deaminase/aldolase [Candidatus Hydrogenedentota bacterium]